MKKLILFVAIIVPGYCFAQVSVSFSTGLAGFKMEEMKNHQMELQAQFPTDVKIIESFPSFWFYELSIIGEVADRVRVGGALGFTSTGGRMHYRDYSGAIECNQLTTAWTLAAQVDLLLTANKKWPVYFTCKNGLAFGRYDLSITAELNNTPDSDNLKFHSTNFFIEPGLMMSKPIVGILSANLMAGYNASLYKGNQKFDDNDDLYLQDNSGKPITLDWSGFRLGVGLSLTF